MYNLCMSMIKELISNFWQKYERPLLLVAAIGGFIFDLFLAKRPDSIADNILLVSYLFIVGALIVLLNIHEKNVTAEGGAMIAPMWTLLIMQFCFGGLANNLLILYGKSGTLGGDLVFIGFLAAFALGNEYLKTKYGQLRFNVAVYYFLLLTYLVMAVPTFVMHTIGTQVFLISGAASLVFIALFLRMLYRVVLRGQPGAHRKLYEVSGIVLLIFALFNVLYFTNIIPPVPLSLKSIGIYHTVTRTADGNYSATLEPSPWYIFWRDTSATYTWATGESATCFSAVFAPAELFTPIYQRWEYFYPTTGDWITVAHVQFPISGGRAQGYRGFTTKTKLEAGQWRCDVETASGQLIGRISFDVVESSSTPTLSSVTL